MVLDREIMVLDREIMVLDREIMVLDREIMVLDREIPGEYNRVNSTKLLEHMNRRTIKYISIMKISTNELLSAHIIAIYISTII